MESLKPKEENVCSKRELSYLGSTEILSIMKTVGGFWGDLRV